LQKPISTPLPGQYWHSICVAVETIVITIIRLILRARIVLMNGLLCYLDLMRAANIGKNADICYRDRIFVEI